MVDAVVIGGGAAGTLGAALASGNGARAVLLEPLDPSREFTGTRVNRVLERILLRIFRIR